MRPMASALAASATGTASMVASRWEFDVCPAVGLPCPAIPWPTAGGRLASAHLRILLYIMQGDG